MVTVVADESAIEDFLGVYVGDAIQLAAIAAEGGSPQCRWFGNNARAAATWACEQNSQGANVYWTVNRIYPGLDRKPSKSDIAGVRYAHVDIDPPDDGSRFDKEVVARGLCSTNPKPTLIVDSGGGLQAFWALQGETSKKQVEHVNRAIALRFGGDSCWNVDRLMRLPGTINYPNAKKRRSGRVRALATSVLEHSEDYTIEELEIAFLSSVGILPVRSCLEHIGIPHGHPLYDLLASPRGIDRSRDTLAAACEMLRHGYDDDVIKDVLLEPTLPISAHALAQSDPDRAVTRALEKAHKLVPTQTPQLGEGQISATPYNWPDMRTLPLRRWVYGKQLLRGTLALIVAPGGMGKTALTVGMALSLATGRPLLGKDVLEGAQRVWVWNLEDDRRELDRAIAAACLFHEIRREDVGGELFVDSGLDGAGLCTATQTREGLTVLTPVYEALSAEIRRHKIDVLIVDPFVSSHQVAENDNGAIDAVAKAWARLAATTDCVVVIVHHTSKAGGLEITAERARGAVSLVNAARSVVALNRMDGEEARRLGVRSEERRRYFRAFDDKNNRAPPAESSEWYRLESVSLPNGNDGDCLGDNVGVVVPWSPPAARSETLEEALVADLQAMVANSEWRESDRAESWVGKAVGEIFGLDPDERADRAQIKAILKQCIKTGWLDIERRRDAHREMRPWIVVGRDVNSSSPTTTGEE